jgi:hypothetical protein
MPSYAWSRRGTCVAYLINLGLVVHLVTVRLGVDAPDLIVLLWPR